MKGLGVVGEKSYAFAIRIVNAYKILCRNNEFVLSKQLLRSGTAIGALCSEAQHAQSKADFFFYLNIAVQDTNETTYWLNLLRDPAYLDVDLYEPLIHDCLELVKILTKTVKTTKENLRKGCL